MEVEWDEDKASSNLKKHGVDFADAGSVLLDDMALTIVDDSVEAEERSLHLARMRWGASLSLYTDGVRTS